MGPRGDGGSGEMNHRPAGFPTRSVRPEWRGARVAESGSLLRSCVGDCTEGSNPSLSEMPYIDLKGVPFRC